MARKSLDDFVDAVDKFSKLVDNGDISPRKDYVTALCWVLLLPILVIFILWRVYGA